MLPIIVPLLVLWSSSLLAAPGDIAQAPVSQSTGVKPNIMLILDDSGSMTFEDTLNNGVEAEFDLVPTDSVRGYGLIYEDSVCVNWEQGWWGERWCTERESGYQVKNHLYAALGTCRGFNVMAYDPEITYSPWVGFDEAPLSDIDSLYYLRWDDEDADGEYDFGECGYSKSGSDYVQGNDHRIDLSGGGLSQAQKQNYANWFYYYRDRMKASQGALLGLVGNVNGRIGFNTIHDRQDVDVEDLTEGQRTSLATAIMEASGSGDTPLRSALNRTGQLFSDPNDTPILSKELGGMCQQNYAVLMSDGYYDLESGLPSIGNVDGGNHDLIRESDKDDVSYTLADFAMKYYIEDLSDLEDLVPIVPGVDENPAQHLVTYTVGFGVNGTLDANPTQADQPFDGWPEGPTSNIAQTLYAVDDMRHAAWNSRGKFLSAADPVALQAAFYDIASDISARSVSTGSLAISRFETGNGNVVLQTQYDPKTWEGDVLARKLDEDDGSLKSPTWSFSEALKSTDFATRNVYTYNPEGDEGHKAFEFRASNWNNDPGDRFSQTQKRDLRKGFRQDGGRRYSAIGRADFINFFRGDDQHEGVLRERVSPFLGDIINSSPVIVDGPAGSYPDKIEDDSYSAYRHSIMDRGSVAYVGSNGGMLHAIDMTDGSELFTFIPHGLFSTEAGKGLHLLAGKDYVHRYYVDGNPVARDAFIKTGSGPAAWHTVLLGGLGGGGKSVYMLDITDPLDFGTAADVVKWEFSHPNLGYTFSDIEVAKLADGDWYAIFGNGYNADQGHGQASLFMVNLENESDFIELTTGVGSRESGQSCTYEGSDCNGLSSPEIADLDGDGIYDWVYAGDLHGNVWAFDLTAFDGTADSTSTLRLFESCADPSKRDDFNSDNNSACQSDDRQPISTRVAVERNPLFAGSKSEPYLNVYWGTGQMLAADDVSDRSSQTFYSVLHTGKEPPKVTEPAYYHEDLQEQEFISPTDMDGNATGARYASGSAVDYLGANPDPLPDLNPGKDSAKQYGWYINLTDDGERLVRRPVIAGDLVAFNTTVPGVGSICEAASRGWLNALSLSNGLPPRRGYGAYDATAGKNQVFDYNQDGEFSSEDLVEQQSDGESNIIDGEVVVSIQMEGEPTAPEFIGENQYVGVTNGRGDGILLQKTQIISDASLGRTGWYQIR
ncbi:MULTISPECIES: PilC/PilY family type IV pilus protein [unclassified Halomonas]|uniref:pilus assembly protein n=1 Tax=unclassified Halomonas TaxID=2609666 RepID=UPI0028885E2F|nr:MULTISPECIES: PilC/PilY family type IV pilus protein [unclassified Halomonas]MDT0501734.1 PilC/PilY family type IV pilus protein [Halomonas sp. PAR7]MDT0513436.1 PilC/PilY family type IV pilus protein [Halomonas sp. LES1]MDT0591797.1 PilC/PilY family type IV pilus protein [Halomonas sp. PAR8]